jgi:hypothetical protein
MNNTGRVQIPRDVVEKWASIIKSVAIKIYEIFMQTAKTYEKCCKDRTYVADGNIFSVLNDMNQQN